jgi:peptide-methionine (R)-S-oxide reductase
MPNRRTLLTWAAGTLAVAAIDIRRLHAEGFTVTLSDAQWRQKLSPEQYAVLRQAETEQPFTSPLLKEHRHGDFLCAGCDLALFSSTTKFDSGTGWPSFFRALPGAVITSKDTSYGMIRDEVRCSRCGGHLGHVFDDGPAPTGLRYCMNGLALKFRAAAG